MKKIVFILKIDEIRPNILHRSFKIAELAMCVLQLDESNQIFL